ncbi:MAG: SRPBCC family protein [Pseudonocardiales bacterium]|nr:SRPBCC family protein [Pseudonocardiales bacterium]
MTDTALLEQQIAINAPVQNVFAVVANLENFPRYGHKVSDATKIGDAMMVTYSPKVPGLNLTLPISFRFKVSLADVQESTAVTMDMDGLIKGTARWNLEDQGSSTLLKVSINYQLSVDAIRSALGGGSDKGDFSGKIGNAVGGIANGVARVISPLLTTNSSNVMQALVNIKRLSED